MNISLRPITVDNLRTAARLRVAENQQNWVAPNAFSVAEASFYPGLWFTRGIYAEETMVGFVLYGKEEKTGRWYIIRFMIGEAHQKQGYGRAAMPLIVQEMRQTRPDCTDIWISFVPGNDVARDLYAKLGFVDTGEIEEGEIVYRLPADVNPM